MFGLGKRMGKEEQFLAIATQATNEVRARIGGADAVSLCAYFSALIAQATCSEDKTVQDRRAETLRERAFDLFGHNNTISLIWSTSYAAAIEAYITPGEWDARLPFFEAREKMFPWEYPPEALMQHTAEIQEVVDELTHQYYRRWR